MKKLIKNYTTEVPVDRTIAEIQKLLVENGARAIASEYDAEGKIKDIFFKIVVQKKELPFRLPAKPEKVYAALRAQQPDYMHRRYGKQWQAEAERIAWRICKSWLEVQITLVNLEQASMEEVFLPFLVVSTTQTLYQAMQEQHFQLPSGNK